MTPKSGRGSDEPSLLEQLRLFETITVSCVVFCFVYLLIYVFGGGTQIQATPAQAAVDPVPSTQPVTRTLATTTSRDLGPERRELTDEEVKFQNRIRELYEEVVAAFGSERDPETSARWRKDVNALFDARDDETANELIQAALDLSRIEEGLKLHGGDIRYPTDKYMRQVEEAILLKSVTKWP